MLGISTEVHNSPQTSSALHNFGSLEFFQGNAHVDESIGERSSGAADGVNIEWLVLTSESRWDESSGDRNSVGKPGILILDPSV